MCTTAPIHKTLRQKGIQGMIRAILIILALCSTATAQNLPTPSDAVGWAVAHQALLDETQRPLYRYVWIPPWMPYTQDDKTYTEKHIAATLSYAINEAASQTGLIIQPEVIANGWMIAVYLPSYASSSKSSLANDKNTQLQQLVNTWDSIAINEPYFHSTKENSNVKQAVLAQHLRQDTSLLLYNINLSPALIYRADHFLEQLLGVKYYEFMQFGNLGTGPNSGKVVRQSADKSLLVDQRNVYELIGVNEALSQKVDGDQRIALFTSGVTGKPRRVDRLQGASGRFGTGAVWQTWDVADESVDTTKHPLYNLLDFKSDGGEAIFEKSNGLHGYILYDGTDRNLVTEAPANLVSDSTIPAPPDGPGTRRLLPGISCIRCHGSAEGLQTITNDVTTLLKSGTDIVDDLSNLSTPSTDTVNRLAGLYSGDFGKRIMLGRQDYTEAVRRATSMPGLLQGMDVTETSKVVSKLYNDYSYKRVTTEQACRELGFEPGAQPQVTFNKILPPQPDATNGLFFENAIIASLRAGIPVRRKDWEQVYSAARLHTLQSGTAQ